MNSIQINSFLIHADNQFYQIFVLKHLMHNHRKLYKNRINYKWKEFTVQMNIYIILSRISFIIKFNKTTDD